MHLLSTCSHDVLIKPFNRKYKLRHFVAFLDVNTVQGKTFLHTITDSNCTLFILSLNAQAEGNLRFSYVWVVIILNTHIPLIPY